MITYFATPFVNLKSLKRRANIQTNYCFNNSYKQINIDQPQARDSVLLISKLS